VSFETERDVIRQRLASSWGSTTAIAWDGFNLGTYAVQEGVPFIRPRIEDGESEFVAVASPTRRFRHYATLLVEVYRPTGEGDEAGNQNCDALIAAFAGYSSGGVSFMRRGTPMGPSPDGKFARWTVLLPYYREESA